MMGQWVGQWVGSCQITKSQINFKLMEIIQLWTFWTFLDILLKPRQPFIGLFFPVSLQLLIIVKVFTTRYTLVFVNLHMFFGVRS